MLQFSNLLIIYAAWYLLPGTGFIFSTVKLWKSVNVNTDNHTAFPVQMLERFFSYCHE